MSKPSIVFAHGIWADGSCFQKLIPTLRAEGHDVMADVFKYVEVADGRVWMKPEGVSCFAGDLTPDEQGTVWSTHFAPAFDLFTQKLDGVAWRSKPSWSIVASQDRTVHPDLERFAATRMGARTVEIESSHVAMLSHPKVVLDVIREAAKAVS